MYIFFVEFVDFDFMLSKVREWVRGCKGGWEVGVGFVGEMMSMGGDVGCCWVDDVVLKLSMSIDKIRRKEILWCSDWFWY